MNKESLSKILFNRDEYLIDYITNLQEENKKLKEQLEYLRSNEYLNQVKWERNFNEDLVKELQQRIDKLIEIIELTIELDMVTTAKGLSKILNILKGEDK